ncbi:AAA family ATPase [Neisseria sp. Ec49-e6-T10]|uniref:AAA family ATPase n=1 Tax=Neisseria sp. Ec49-e6-T10 TaxID=3140744 RepID=UPI003EBDA1FD
MMNQDQFSENQTMANNPFAKASELTILLRNELKKAVIGQDKVIEEVLIAFLAGGHVLLEGVPGLGKTLLVRSLATIFSGTFSRVQFTPDLMPTDITGHSIFDMKSQTFHLHKGPVFANLLLADEINRAPAKTQAALLEVMQEQAVTLEGKTQPVPHPFMVMATENPIEQEGTYPLPEAQLDRFMFKVLIDYPTAEHEAELVKQVTMSARADILDQAKLQKILSIEQVQALQKITARMPVDEQIIHYAVRLVQATRTWQGLAVGAGPRATIALIAGARARALLRGMNFVTPDDIKAIWLPTLRHRVRLSPELEIEGYSIDQVLTDIAQQVNAPRL